jgi:hypothetical protein
MENLSNFNRYFSNAEIDEKQLKKIEKLNAEKLKQIQSSQEWVNKSKKIIEKKEKTDLIIEKIEKQIGRKF